MEKDAIQQIAFQIISAAGVAFDYFYKSLEAARSGDFKEAEKMIASGDRELSKAHHSQTEFLSAEARGDDIEYSVIMAHAQDSLMTTILFERVVKEFIILYQDKESFK